MKKVFYLFALLLFAINVSAQRKGTYVTNNKLMFMPDSTIKGNAGTVAATPSDLTPSEVRGILQVLASADTASLSNRINTKLASADTASISGRIDLKLAASDTASLSNRIINRFVGLPEYADDTAAGVGGLTAGQIYRTAAGVIMVKL